MQQNTTDHIAKLAYTTTKTHWKEFIGLPALVAIGFFVLMMPIAKIFGEIAILLLPITMMLGLCIFFVSFGTAVSKWTESIYSGKKTINLKEGLRYGLSRFWGVIGTHILTTIKMFLWMLLLIIPGYYKAITYSFSTKISALEKISGGDANRLSEMLVKRSGFLRTLGNMMAISIILVIIIYIYMAISFLIGISLGAMGDLGANIMESIAMTIVGITISGLVGLGFLTMGVFMHVFKTYEYLIYKEENETEFTKMAKILKKV